MSETISFGALGTASTVRTQSSDAPGVASTTQVPSRLAGRYLLGALLGAGGFGQVYTGVDERTGDAVAVKLVPMASSRDWARLRQELVGLRHARLPGFARLLDEGHHGAMGFIVMARVDGSPFPGIGWEDWGSLRPLALAVLESLGRLHARGLLHLDLKPANVLIDPAGRPVIIDLGLAARIGVRQDEFRGTPAYAAPEQWRAQPLGRGADLYAVGAMLYAALAGRLAHRPEEGGIGRPAPLATHRPDLPADLIAVVDRLLAPEPAARFPTAAEVIEALGGHLDAPLPGLADLPAWSEPQALAALFHGPEPCLHLPSDAAEALFARTGGVAAAVRREVQAWTRAGLAWPEGDRLRIEREALERLRGGLVVDTQPLPGRALPAAAHDALMRLRGAWPDTWPAWAGVDATTVDLLQAAGAVWPLPDGRVGLQVSSADPELPEPGGPIEAAPDPSARLRRLLRGVRAGASLSPAAVETIERALDEDGRRLWPLLEALFESLDGDAVPPDLLRLFVGAALRQESPAALDVALRALAAVPQSHLVERLDALVQGTRFARINEPARARAWLTGLGPFADDRLDQWRQMAWLALARGASPAESAAALQRMGPWAEAGDAERRAVYAGWLGNLRYRQGRFAEAVDLHTQAWRHKRNRVGRLGSLRNRASAHLALGALDEAARDAAAVVAEAERLRHPSLELAGWRIRRCAEYRGGRVHGPRLDLLDAAAQISPFEEGLLALNEAAIAWRAGGGSPAEPIALRARACFRRLRYGLHEAMAAALLALIRQRATPDERARLEAAAGHPGTPPGCALQLLGVCGRFGGGDRDRLVRLVDAWPSERRPQRLELISPDESLEIGLNAEHRE